PFLTSRERIDAAVYGRSPDAQTLSKDEQSHARALRTIQATHAKGNIGSTLSWLEGRHAGAGGNALRAAVLGVNDGLVSNLSLVMGVAGAALDQRTVLLTGFAGLLAGAIS